MDSTETEDYLNATSTEPGEHHHAPATSVTSMIFIVTLIVICAVFIRLLILLNRFCKDCLRNAEKEINVEPAFLYEVPFQQQYYRRSPRLESCHPSHAPAESEEVVEKSVEDFYKAYYDEACPVHGVCVRNPAVLGRHYE